MKISELTNCPSWLSEAITTNADVDVSATGWVTWKGGDFCGGDFRGGDFCGGDFWGGNFLGGNFRGGDFCGGDFRGGNFRGGNFLGGKIKGQEAAKLRAYCSLYCYQVSAVLMPDGSRWVQMGCLFKSLEDWEKIGIRKSNLSEFPDDGSDASEERAAAFEFAKSAALRLK